MCEIFRTSRYKNWIFIHLDDVNAGKSGIVKMKLDAYEYAKTISPELIAWASTPTNTRGDEVIAMQAKDFIDPDIKYSVF